jgi:hypothetical protein
MVFLFILALYCVAGLIVMLTVYGVYRLLSWAFDERYKYRRDRLYQGPL